MGYGEKPPLQDMPVEMRLAQVFRLIFTH